MKRFFQIVGAPLRLVFGLGLVFLIVFVSLFNPEAAIEITNVLHWIHTGGRD